MIKIIEYKRDYISEFIRGVFGEEGEGVVLSHFGWEVVKNFTSLGGVVKNFTREEKVVKKITTGEEKEETGHFRKKQEEMALTELAEALWAGKTIWTPEETLEPPRAGELGRLLKRTRRELERMGVCPVELTALKFWVKYGAAAEGLLTAERVESLAAQGVRGIFLLPGSRVTPLAERRAKEKTMILRREWDRCGWEGWSERYGVPAKPWS